MEIQRDHVDEPVDEPVDEQVDAPPSDESASRTGVEPVDRVLDSLDDLDELPVEDHVAVFEQAHERLRGALDDPSPSIPAALRPDA